MDEGWNDREKRCELCSIFITPCALATLCLLRSFTLAESTTYKTHINICTTHICMKSNNKRLDEFGSNKRLHIYVFFVHKSIPQSKS